jgi:hypothetical protein
MPIESSPSALGCLRVGADGPPVYPEYERDRKREGLVRVRLRFTDAEAPPAVEVMHDMGGPAFTDVVRRHLATYRLPCLQPSVAPVSAIQEFQFLPGDGRPVYWTPARIEESRGAEFVGCVERGPLPNYPHSALRAGVQGVALVRLSFSSPDAAPQAEVLYDGGHAKFADIALDHAATYRLPCLTSERAPFQMVQQFEFTIDGHAWYVLRPLTESAGRRDR